MAPTSYADVLAKNARSARSRAGLQLEPVAARMRALGYSKWKRQTVASVEKGERRLTAEEMLGLSIALETSIAALMAPSDDDKVIDLPSGETVSVAAVQLSAHGINESDVRWEGAVPLFTRGGPHPPSWLAETSYIQAIQKARRRLGWESLSAEEQEQKLVDSAALAAGGLPERAGLPYSIPMSPIRQEPLQPVVITAIVTSPLGVLVGHRNDDRPPWTFIAGEQEPGERPEDTVIREVKEETGLRIETGEIIGQRVHPKTGRTMIYMAARPTHGTEVFVGDEEELAEVRWIGLAEADELLPGMYEPVREYLARELAGKAR